MSELSKSANRYGRTYTFNNWEGLKNLKYVFSTKTHTGAINETYIPLDDFEQFAYRAITRY